MNNRRVMPHSRMRTILTSAATFSALSLLPKLLVIAKDAVVAFYFGTGHVLDVYLMAFVLIGIPVSIIVISLHTTLVPALADKNTEIMASLLGGALKLAMGLLLLALPMWLFLIPHSLNALYPGAAETTLSSLQDACYWLIPYYILNGANILLDGALQARKVFWPNAVLPGFFPLSILAAAGLAQGADIRVLLIGTVVGSLLQCAALYIMVLRSCGINWGKTNGYGLRTVLRNALPLMLGGVLSSFAPLIEQMISVRLGPRALSLLNYGNKIPTAVNTFVVTAIGIVILPHFAEMINARQWRQCRTLHLRLSVIVFVIGVAIAAVAIEFAVDIIRVLFERGAFTAADTHDAAKIMRSYLVQLPFMLSTMVATRTLVAMGKTLTMTSIATLQLILCSSLAYLLSDHFGITGVAMGTVVGTAVGSGILGWAAWRGYDEQLKPGTTP